MYIVGPCRLNEILKEKKMSQVELALKLGLKKQQIHSYAIGKRRMSIQTAKNISHILNVNMEELYYFVWSDEQ